MTIVFSLAPAFKPGSRITKEIRALAPMVFFLAKAKCGWHIYPRHECRGNY